MKLETHLKRIRIAMEMTDWLSSEEHVEYETDFSTDSLFVEGEVVFFNETVLEFTVSITPEKERYHYQYMRSDHTLIFRYDNVPHF